MLTNCQVCQKDYEADPKRLQHGRQTTCSRECSYKLRAGKRTKRKIKRCPCGKEFCGLPRNVYCSRKCVYTYAYKNKSGRKDKGIQRVFYSYVCEFCGKDFHPRHPRTKSRLFCSRKCYEKQKSVDMSGLNNPMYGKSPKFKPTWRQGWHTVGNKRYYFRSSWEVSVACYLELKGYDWGYEVKRYKLGNELTYVPDFFILKNGEITRIIEVKGWLKAKDKLKIKLFRQQFNTPLVVWSRPKLKQLKLLDVNGYGKIH